LAEAFAEVVRRFSFLESEGYTSPRYRFSLMDISFDGELRLLVHLDMMKNGFPYFLVFDRDAAMEFIYLPDNEVDSFIFGWPNNDFSFTPLNRIDGLYPMRFYQNDNTGEVMFSSYSFGGGGGVSNWVTYTNNRTFEAYRVVECISAGWVRHVHLLRDASPLQTIMLEDGTITIESIALFDIGPEQWHWEEGFELCHIELEGDSPTPTIVQLVNMALEGFTEIPAPEWHVPEDFYDWHFKWDTYPHEAAQLIAGWIHSVIG